MLEGAVRPVIVADLELIRFRLQADFARITKSAQGFHGGRRVQLNYGR